MVFFVHNTVDKKIPYYMSYTSYWELSLYYISRVSSILNQRKWTITIKIKTTVERFIFFDLSSWDICTMYYTFDTAPKIDVIMRDRTRKTYFIYREYNYK